MKTIIILATLAIAFLGAWYKGQLSDFITSPQAHGLPEIPSLTAPEKLLEKALPEPRDLSQIIKEDSRHARTEELIDKERAASLIEFAQLKTAEERQSWLAKQSRSTTERTEIDKLLNFLARGKWE